MPTSKLSPKVKFKRLRSLHRQPRKKRKKAKMREMRKRQRMRMRMLKKKKRRNLLKYTRVLEMKNFSNLAKPPSISLPSDRNLNLLTKDRSGARNISHLRALSGPLDSTMMSHLKTRRRKKNNLYMRLLFKTRHLLTKI